MPKHSENLSFSSLLSLLSLFAILAILSGLFYAMDDHFSEFKGEIGENRAFNVLFY